MNTTSTDVTPPDKIENQVRSVLTWNEAVLAQGKYSNPEFWTEYDSIAKRSFDEQRRVQTIAKVGGESTRTTFVPPAGVSDETLERKLEILTWQELLHAIGTWTNPYWLSKLDDLCYEAFVEEKDIHLSVQLEKSQTDE